jgi:thymidylate kinase
MLDLVRVLLTDLNRRQVRYCHWKSNASLDQALEGIGDLDLLVDPDHASVLSSILAELGFVEALPADGPGDQASRHYVGLDEPSGRLVHLDVYDRLLTGGTLLKNHHLPLEAMLFASLRCQDSVPVPGQAAELVLLVLRKLIESASPLEHALLLREHDQVRREVSWLAANAATRADAAALVRGCLPNVDPRLFELGLAALHRREAVVQRFVLGRRLLRCLRAYEVRPRARAVAERRRRFVQRILRRCGLGPRGFRLPSGGVIVAFIGPEASGKSTLVAETSRWLGHIFDVHTIHAGTPPASLLTAIPTLLLPLLRSTLPRYRTGNIEAEEVPVLAGRGGLGFWFYLVRCVALGYDRARLLRRAGRLKNAGAIIVSDRYPTTHLGFVDSRQLDESQLAAASNTLAARLARLERKLYASIPPADLVITCQVPMAMMLRRNAARQKLGGPEPDDYVRRRHIQFVRRLPDELQTHLLDTTQSLDDVLRTVRRMIWRALVAHAGPAPGRVC